MKQVIIPFLFSLMLCACGPAPEQADIVIVGATPGGIAAAVTAARAGHSCIILERSSVPGGLPANGLGATDIATRGATAGFFTEFVGRVRDHYAAKYGTESPEYQMCSDGYHFEPHVAQEVFETLLSECGDKVQLRTLRQFDARPECIRMQDGRIGAIRITQRETGKQEWYKAKVFIDATYEGDLGAAAGAPFVIGREAASEYGEKGAGKIYKYWEGAEDSGSTARTATELPLGEGSTGEADDAVQAYNYRLCLTNRKDNQIPFYKPERYDREEYVSLVDDVLSGRNTNHTMAFVTAAQMERNRRIVAAGGETTIPGDRWGIAKITNMVRLPNDKTDANNQHLALISTDLPEENWPWPTADWAWRDAFARRLRDYTLGLLWFAATDEALPAQFRAAVSEWGFAADEYPDNGGFPRQIYVREGRRFKGDWFFIAADATPVAPGARPPLHPDSITSSHYALDSHGVRKREPERIHLDGFLSYPSAPYTVPYGVITSPGLKNLLLPVPVSGSHMGFSTLRMEPCWMALGQAAGTAAVLALEGGSDVHDIDLAQLQQRLLDAGACLIYFKDLPAGGDDYALAAKAALKGYIPEWEARLNEAPSEGDLSLWSRIAGRTVQPAPTRREALRALLSE